MLEKRLLVLVVSVVAVAFRQTRECIGGSPVGFVVSVQRRVWVQEFLVMMMVVQMMMVVVVVVVVVVEARAVFGHAGCFRDE